MELLIFQAASSKASKDLVAALHLKLACGLSTLLSRSKAVPYVVRPPSKPGKTELIPLPVQQQLSAKVARAGLQRAVHQPPVFMV